jgi:hypothetical protein
MTTQVKKPMLAFDHADLPKLPIVELHSFANVRVHALDELPHACIDFVDSKTAERRHAFVHFVNNTWDSRLHDSSKLGGMLDEWLEKLKLDLDAGSSPKAEYDFVHAFASPMGYQPGGWDNSPQGRWGGGFPQQRPFGQPAHEWPNARFPAFPLQSPQEQQAMYDPKAISRRVAAQNLLTQLTKDSDHYNDQRLNLSWVLDSVQTDSLYMNLSIGGGVKMVIRREAIASEVSGDPDQPLGYTEKGVLLPHVGGTVKLHGVSYNFAFSHEVLGDYFRQSVSNELLKSGFERVWTQFGHAIAGRVEALELIFNEQ